MHSSRALAYRRESASESKLPSLTSPLIDSSTVRLLVVPGRVASNRQVRAFTAANVWCAPECLGSWIDHCKQFAGGERFEY